MDLDVLNRYALAAVALFAALLYVAIAFTGFTELISGLPKRCARRKKLRARSPSRRSRD